MSLMWQYRYAVQHAKRRGGFYAIQQAVVRQRAAAKVRARAAQVAGNKRFLQSGQVSGIVAAPAVRRRYAPEVSVAEGARARSSSQWACPRKFGR